jgi:hypothetical protein
MIDKLFRTGLDAEEMLGDLEIGRVDALAMAQGEPS